jgi:exopolyphosphatase/guanosine-5'-triphosphate,3'-diphosphate pyrophosphatase
LCADLDEGLSHPLRGRQETQLFLLLDKHGEFSPEAILRVRRAVSILFGQAVMAGAERIFLTATSAARDAGNVDLLSGGIQEDTGLELRILSGEEEATYSFLGAAHPYEWTRALGVIDIGGGSTEIAIGSREALRLTRSLQLGASRLCQTHPINSMEDIAPALAASSKLLDGGLEGLNPAPEEWLLVGGTGAALIGLMLGRMMHSDAPDIPFSHEDALRVLHQLALLSPAGRAALPGMTSGRERILPTGLVILVSLMERVCINKMTVTARNNTDGFLYSIWHENEGRS